MDEPRSAWRCLVRPGSSASSLEPLRASVSDSRRAETRAALQVSDYGYVLETGEPRSRDQVPTSPRTARCRATHLGKASRCGPNQRSAAISVAGRRSLPAGLLWRSARSRAAAQIEGLSLLTSPFHPSAERCLPMRGGCCSSQPGWSSSTSPGSSPRSTRTPWISLTSISSIREWKAGASRRASSSPARSILTAASASAPSTATSRRSRIRTTSRPMR